MMTKKNTGCRMRTSGMPAAFIESNSNFSPRLPKVMSEASRMARGSDMGTSVSPL